MKILRSMNVPYGMVFYVPLWERENDSIVVVCPTANEDAIIGGEDDLTDAVICKLNTVEVVSRKDGVRYAVPVSLAGEQEVRIVSTSEKDRTYWTWSRQTGKTFLRRYMRIHGEWELANFLMFVDETHVIEIADNSELEGEFKANSMAEALYLMDILRAETDAERKPIAQRATRVATAEKKPAKGRRKAS